MGDARFSVARGAGKAAMASLYAACLAALLGSCATMQDDHLVSIDDQTLADRLSAVEEDAVRVDSLTGKEKASAIEAARAKIAALEKLNASDTVFQSRLLAWSGRLYLSAGKRSDAAKRYDAAKRLLPSDVPTAILGARLAKNDDAGLASLEQALLIEPGDPRLSVERALFLSRLGKYADSVAAFDGALSRLPSFYRETYQSVRDRAWELRGALSAEDETLSAILASPSVSWQDTVTWCLAKTAFLNFETAGKPTSAQKLFPKLIASGLVPARENGTFPLLSDSVSRAETAWFVWHGIAENRADKSILNKYSKRWTGAAESAAPIPDIPIGSPFFDSVMGCVESEIMALPDGKHFRPQNAVSGADLSRIMGKAGN